MCYVRLEKYFPLTKQNLCSPPSKFVNITNALTSTKLLLWSQIFHDVLLAN